MRIWTRCTKHSALQYFMYNTSSQLRISISWSCAVKWLANTGVWCCLSWNPSLLVMVCTNIDLWWFTIIVCNFDSGIIQLVKDLISGLMEVKGFVSPGIYEYIDSEIRTDPALAIRDPPFWNPLRNPESTNKLTLKSGIHPLESGIQLLESGIRHLESSRIPKLVPWNPESKPWNLEYLICFGESFII